MIELIWQYAPKEFFEAELTGDLLGGRIQIVSGNATFTTTAEPEDARHLISDVADRLTWLFDSRALLTAVNYSLSEPQYTRIDAEGRCHATLFVHSVSHGHTADRVDLIVRDASGRVIGDSKAERLARHSSYVFDLAEKCALSPTLQAMLVSFKASLTDPPNALVHLYEIRDAATKHFGTSSTARRALEISNAEWRRLGELANDAPLAEGRHRGRSAQDIRPATPAELAEARDVARLIIEAFGSSL